MAIEAGEYIGNGAASRVITPGGTIRGLAVVFVWRLRGAPDFDFFGYLRVRSQSDGRATAFIASEDTAGLDGKDNKITAMSATTFTVGADLNTSGESHFWVAFDQEETVISGTYTGDGGAQTVNSVLTLSGTGFTVPVSVTGQGPFHTTGSVGKQLETTATHPSGNGVLICTITAVAASGGGSQSVTATMEPGFTSGTVLGNDWRLRSRSISLPFAPDLFIVFRTRTTADGVPGSGTDGQLVYWTRNQPHISEATARCRSFGSDETPGHFHMIPGEDAFHVQTNQREDNALNTGPNIENETYFYVAIRAGTPNNLRRNEYVGDGTANVVELRGAPFDPLHLFIFPDETANANQNDRYDSNEGSQSTFGAIRFNPNFGEQTSMTATFVAGGADLAGAGSGIPLNVNGANYLVLLFRAGHIFIGGNRSLFMSHPNDQGKDLAMSHPNDQGSLVLSHPNDQGDDLVMSI